MVQCLLQIFPKATSRTQAPIVVSLDMAKAATHIPCRHETDTKPCVGSRFYARVTLSVGILGSLSGSWMWVVGIFVVSMISVPGPGIAGCV
jgi:hypothetical protein